MDDRYAVYPYRWRCIGWAAEYFATTVEYEEKDRVINYIKSQPEHHSTTPFADELEYLLKKSGETYLPEFLT